MAAKKKAKRPVRPAVKYINVGLVALGRDPIQVKVRRGTDIEGFLAANIPAGWNLDGVDVAVNGVPRDQAALLSDGDTVTFVPRVAGGR